MSSIGPALPPHLQNISHSLDEDDDDDSPGPSMPSVGPQIPSHLVAGPSKPAPQPATGQDAPADDSDDDDDYGPSLPPDLLASRAGSSAQSAPKRVVGPSFPPPIDQLGRARYGGGDEDSDDDVGPMPLPAGMEYEEKDGVQEFIEREERRRKQIEVLFF